MLLSKPSFRIAAHTLPDYRRHGDLFIELPGHERLLTFEMDGVLLDLLKKDLDRVYLMLADRSLESELRSQFEVFDSLESLIERVSPVAIRKVALKRKEDHRKMYMSYTGRVETRGSLEDFTRGRIDGFLFGAADTLIVVDL
jgi:hypothetical protein